MRRCKNLTRIPIHAPQEAVIASGLRDANSDRKSLSTKENWSEPITSEESAIDSASVSMRKSIQHDARRDQEGTLMTIFA